MNFKVVVKAVLLNEDGEVLLLRRSMHDDKRPGELDFPGGGVEIGEDVTVAMVREVHEEVGLVINQAEAKIFYAHTDVVGGESITRLVFYIRVDKPQIVLSFEHSEYRWVNAEKVSAEFPHPVWGASVDYALKHGLFDTSQAS
jgi:8-oxo-dGTP diphosphatase